MPALSVTRHNRQSSSGVNAIKHQLQYRPGVAGSSVEHDIEGIRYILCSIYVATKSSAFDKIRVTVM